MGVIGIMSRTKFFAAASLLLTLTSLAGLGAWAGQSSLAVRESPRKAGNGIVPDGVPAGTTVVVAQAEGVTRRQPIGRDSEADQKPATDLPADFPAFVVETQPKLGDVDVDPAAIKQIRVTFSKPMMDRSWSWTKGNVYSFPESAGEVHYLPDQRTCVMPAKLEPGRTYVIGINGARFEDFRDTDGKPALPTTLAFRTRAATARASGSGAESNQRVGDRH
jgi:RNA polymerase sigma-70 factor (ECF subfamily)